MDLNSFIFLDVITYVSLLLSATSFVLLSLLFGDALLVRFDLKTSLKSLGFLLLAVAMALNIFHIYSAVSIWIAGASLSLLFVAFTLDPLSKMRFLVPFPAIFFLFLTGHILLFVLSLITTISIFQLSYTTRHRDLIPLGVGFTLISVGEYLYHLETIERLRNLASAGSFLYLFASIVLLFWVWSYFALRILHYRRSET